MFCFLGFYCGEIGAVVSKLGVVMPGEHLDAMQLVSICRNETSAVVVVAVVAVSFVVLTMLLLPSSLLLFVVVAVVNSVAGGLRKLCDHPSRGGIPDGAQPGTGFLRPRKRNRKGRLCGERGVFVCLWEGAGSESRRSSI